MNIAKSLRKGRGGTAGPMDDKALDQMFKSTSAPAGDKGSRRGDAPKKNFKRERKDEKWGHGGKKKHLKDNTRESIDDFSVTRGRSKSPKRPGQASGPPSKGRSGSRPPSKGRSESPKKRRF